MDAIINFPEGYKKFHKNKRYNYQFNRWYSFGFGREEDLRKAASYIKTFDDWRHGWKMIAEEAETENRMLNAAFYYRAAEFFVPSNDPDKQTLYKKFMDLFKEIPEYKNLEVFEIPYEKGFLPCFRLKAKDESKKKVLVAHGGFDSFMEEFLTMAQFFSENNFEVYVFDGPGQGNARRKHGLVFDYHWEKPVGAVLDYFKLSDVSLLGISLGGYLCLRAAAFEKRIKRVIASSVAYDHMQIPPKLLQPIVKLFYYKLKNYTNNASWKQIKKGGGTKLVH